MVDDKIGFYFFSHLNQDCVYLNNVKLSSFRQNVHPPKTKTENSDFINIGVNLLLPM